MATFCQGVPYGYKKLLSNSFVWYTCKPGNEVEYITATGTWINNYKVFV